MKIRLPRLVAHLAALSMLLGLCGLTRAEDVTVPFFVIVPKGEGDSLALKAVKTDKENEFILKSTASAVYDKNANEKTRDDAVLETDLELVQALKKQNQSYQTLFLDKETGSAVYKANDFKFEISSTIYVTMANMKNWVQQGNEATFTQNEKTYKIDKTLLEQWGKIEPKLIAALKKEESPIPPDTSQVTKVNELAQALFTLTHEG